MGALWLAASSCLTWKAHWLDANQPTAWLEIKSPLYQNVMSRFVCLSIRRDLGEFMSSSMWEHCF
jgi:hypothetical protein